MNLNSWPWQTIFSLVLVPVVIFCLTLPPPALARSNGPVDAQNKEKNCTAKENEHEAICGLSNVSSKFQENGRQTTRGHGKKQQPLFQNNYSKKFKRNPMSTLPSNDHSAQTSREWLDMKSTSLKMAVYDRTNRQSRRKRKVKKRSPAEHIKFLEREAKERAKVVAAYINSLDRRAKVFPRSEVPKNFATKVLGGYIVQNHKFCYVRFMFNAGEALKDKIDTYLGYRIQKQDLGDKQFKTILEINHKGYISWSNHWYDSGIIGGYRKLFERRFRGINAINIHITRRNCPKEEGIYQCIMYVNRRDTEGIWKFKVQKDLQLKVCREWRSQQMEIIRKKRLEEKRRIEEERRLEKERKREQRLEEERRIEEERRLEEERKKLHAEREMKNKLKELRLPWKDSFSLNQYWRLEKQAKVRVEKGFKFKKKIKTSEGINHLVLDCGLQVKDDKHLKRELIMIDILQYDQKQYKPIVGFNRNRARTWSRSMNWVQEYPHSTEKSAKGKRDLEGVYWMELLIPLLNCTKERGKFRCSLYVTDPVKKAVWKYEKHINILDLECEDIKMKTVIIAGMPSLLFLVIMVIIVVLCIKKNKKEKIIGYQQVQGPPGIQSFNHQGLPGAHGPPGTQSFDQQALPGDQGPPGTQSFDQQGLPGAQGPPGTQSFDQQGLQGAQGSPGTQPQWPSENQRPYRSQGPGRGYRTYVPDPSNRPP